MIWVYRTRPTGRSVSIRSCGKYASEARGCYRRIRQARLGLPVDASRIPDLVKGCQSHVPAAAAVGTVGREPGAVGGGLASSRSVADVAGMYLNRVCVGIMRGCEVVLMAGEAFDTEQHLVPADVAFEGKGEGRRVRLRMRKRKDLRVLHGKHDRVILAAAGEAAFFDVVAELEAWLEERKALGIAEDRPLFCHPDGSAVTVRELCAQR